MFAGIKKLMKRATGNLGRDDKYAEEQLGELIFDTVFQPWFTGKQPPRLPKVDLIHNIASLDSDSKRSLSVFLHDRLSSVIVTPMRKLSNGWFSSWFGQQRSLLKRLKQTHHIDSGKLYERDHLNRKYFLRGPPIVTSTGLIYDAVSLFDNKEYVIKYQYVSEGMDDKFFEESLRNEFIIYAITSLLPGYNLSPRPVYISPTIVIDGRVTPFESMAKLGHPICINSECTIEYIILEKAGITLSKYQELPISTNRLDKRIDPVVSLKLLRAGITILGRLHDLGIVHGDIHLGNLCLRDNDSIGQTDLVFIDYGMARIQGISSMPSLPTKGLPPLLLSVFQLEAKRDRSTTISPKPIDDLLRMFEAMSVLYNGRLVHPQYESTDTLESYLGRLISHKSSGEFFIGGDTAARINGIVRTVGSITGDEILRDLDTVIASIPEPFIPDEFKNFQLTSDTTSSPVPDIVVLNKALLSLIRTLYKSSLRPSPGSELIALLKSRTAVPQFGKSRVGFDCPGARSYGTVCMSTSLDHVKFWFGQEKSNFPSLSGIEPTREYALGLVAATDVLGIHPLYLSDQYVLSGREFSKFRILLPQSVHESLDLIRADTHVPNSVVHSDNITVRFMVYKNRIGRRSWAEMVGDPNAEMGFCAKMILEGIELLIRTKAAGIAVGQDLHAKNIFSAPQNGAVFGSLGRSTFDPEALNESEQLRQLFHIITATSCHAMSQLSEGVSRILDEDTATLESMREEINTYLKR
jgi:serine/threonine protein kinase